MCVLRILRGQYIMLYLASKLNRNRNCKLLENRQVYLNSSIIVTIYKFACNFQRNGRRRHQTLGNEKCPIFKTGGKITQLFGKNQIRVQLAVHGMQHIRTFIYTVLELILQLNSVDAVSNEAQEIARTNTRVFINLAQTK